MSDFEIVQVNFRMPKELKDKLEKAAHESGRSITSELVTRLEQSFTQPRPTMVFREMVEDTAKIQDGVFEVDKTKVQELEQKLDTILQEIQTLKKPTA